jgi:hypothetical protein
MNITSRFDQYLENKLSDSERIIFEKELAEKPALADSYSAYAKINQLLRSELDSPLLKDDDDPLLKDLTLSQRLEIEEDIMRFSSASSEFSGDNSILADNTKLSEPDQSPYSTYPESKENLKTQGADFQGTAEVVPKQKSLGNVRLISLYTGIAASLVICFLAGKSIFIHNSQEIKKLSPQQAFTAYYSPKTDSELETLSFSDSRLNAAILDFKRSNINSSSLMSNQMEVSNEDYELSLLYMGLIYLERNDFQEARGCLSRILTNKNSGKIYAAGFYLSLSYLAEDNFSAAKPELDKLTETRNPYYKRAKEILKHVNQE